MSESTPSPEEQKAELRRCAGDFNYFCETYLKVCHPLKGLVPFTLHDFQKRLSSFYETNRFAAVTKFRQGGFTSVTLAWLLWRCMFKLDQRVMALSKTDREACSCSGLVRRLIQELPDWLKPELSRENDHRLEFKETGSRFMFHSPQAACGVALNWLFIDEAAFIPRMEEHWKAMYPTLSTGGSCIVVSTVNGKYLDRKHTRKNWFYQIVSDAREGKNLFKVFEASYKEHPEYNNVEWVSQMVMNLGEMGWRQEMLMEFVDFQEYFSDSA